jgi:uncharacterized protein YjbI with pentapeptide repeats
MSSEPEPDLVTRISQLEQQQVQLKKYITSLKRRLDEHSQQFNTRPELQQLAELQKRLDELCENRVNISSSSETEVSSVEIIPTIPLLETEVIVSSSESQLVFDRLGSRSVLLEALEIAEERVIIVCPWLNCNSIDEHLLQKFRFCLSRNCQIDIGWGYLGDRNKIGKGWRYNALSDLQQLEQDYPDLFRLKLLGTHEKYLVCDDKFAMVGSHNVLTSGVQSAEREVGIRTTDLQIIQGLINRFDESQETEKSEIVQQFLGSIQRLDEAEYLEGIVETEDIDEDEEDEDNFEESQEPPVTAEEFLKRYNEGERDFTGINLAGVDLSSSGESLGSNVNLSNANLRGANLRYMHLGEINFTGANLRKSDLSGAYLVRAKLDRVNFKNADLSKANLREANLKNAKLNNVNLSEANIPNADLSGANLSQADLYKANLDCSKLIATRLNGAELSDAVLTVTNCKNADFTNARLVNADLRGAKLRDANFKEANLQKANLRGNYNNQQIIVDLINVNFENANLQQAICDENTRFPVDFDYLNRGVYLIAPGVSLSNADLSRKNLSYANLSGADLKGVQLQEACIIDAQLSYSDLSQAKLNGTDLRNACLAASKLVEADLREAKLESANLSGADLNSADLRSSQLDYTDLSGADLTNAKLGGANLNNAILKGATMPDGTVHE